MYVLIRSTYVHESVPATHISTPHPILLYILKYILYIYALLQLQMQMQLQVLGAGSTSMVVHTYTCVLGVQHSSLARGLAGWGTQRRQLHATLWPMMGHPPPYPAGRRVTSPSVENNHPTGELVAFLFIRIVEK